MEILGWIIIVALFVIGMAGAIFPVLPGAIAIYFAYFIYGWFFSFQPLTWWFWTIQTLILIGLLVADYAVSAWGVKRFGGSRSSIIFSTIGIIIGPFIIPGVGLIAGPFLGAVFGEMIAGSTFTKSLQVGVGSVIGLFTSTVVKIVLQLAMIIVFILWVV